MSKSKVDFILSSEIVSGAASATLLGDFNNWDANKGIALKKLKDGSFKASVNLEAGQSYQYRYLLNDGRWVNDANADTYVYNDEFQSENCLVRIPEEKKAEVKKSKAAVEVAKELKEKPTVKSKTVKAKATAKPKATAKTK